MVMLGDFFPAAAMHPDDDFVYKWQTHTLFSHNVENKPNFKVSQWL